MISSPATKSNGRIFRLLGLSLFAFLFSFFRAEATHVMGGELTYRYVGIQGANVVYNINLKVYIDGGPGSQFPTGGLGNNPRLGVWSADNNQLIRTIQLPDNPAVRNTVQPALPPGCAPACISSLVVWLNDINLTEALPFSVNGYYLKYESFARNNTTNLGAGNQYGNSYVGFIPAPQFVNNSPQFTDLAIPFMLAGDTTTFVNSAFDPDGDRLVYSFVTPYDGRNPGGQLPANWTLPNNVGYVPNFSTAQPFGPAGVATINSSNGLTKYFAPAAGVYVVAIEIQEFRTLPNGTEVLLSRTRRELQIFVREVGAGFNQCPDNPTPQFATVPQTVFNIQQGQVVNFTLTASDPNQDSLYLIGTSDIIQGTNGYTGPRAGFAAVNGIGVAAATFTWQTNCSVVGNYVVSVAARDRGCPPKTNNLVFNINVSPFRGPTAIAGTSTTCSNVNSYTYVVPPAAQGVTRQWKITGGNLLSQSTNTDTVRVRWTGTSGQVRLVSTSQFGCRDSVQLNITNLVAGNLDAGPNLAICQGESVQLNVSGGTGVYQWSPSNGTLSNINIANPIARPTVTTTYIVSSPNSQGCQLTDTITVTVVPRYPLAPNVTACGTYNGLIGATPVNSATIYTHQWLDSVGFVSPATSAVANVILTNNSDTTQVYTFRLRSRTSTPNAARACDFFDTLTVTLRPLPRFTPLFVDTVICPQTIVTMGPSSLRTNTTYNWNTTEGFVVGTANTPNPQVRLANLSSNNRTVQYILTATDGSTNCTYTDTITVTARPGIFEAEPRDTTTCANVPVVIGTPARARIGYQWAPATGLNNTNIAQPTLTLANAGTTPLVAQYTRIAVDSVTNCLQYDTIQVTVFPAERATVSVDTICFNTASTLGSETQGYSYSWAPANLIASGGNTASATTIALQNNGTGLLRYTLLRTGINQSNNCIVTDTFHVEVSPAFVANAGPDTSICTQASLTTGETNMSGFSYQWQVAQPAPAEATIIFTNNAVSPVTLQAESSSPNPLTVGIVLLKTDNLSGCIQRDTLNLIIQPKPVVNVGPNDTLSVCSNAEINLGAAPEAERHYAWSPAFGLNDSTLANPVLKLINTTQDTLRALYRLRVTNTLTGCVNTDSVLVLVLPLPLVSLTDTIRHCAGTDVVVGPTAQTGFAYNWSPATYLSATDIAQPTFSRVIPNGMVTESENLQLIVTNLATSCSDTFLTTIITQPLPIANAGNDTSLCANETVTIGSAGITGLSYSWAPTTGLSSETVSQPTLTLSNNNLVPDTLIYVVTVTNDATGCQNTDSVTVIVFPRPIPEPIQAGATAVCPNIEGVTYSVTDRVGFTYNWEVSGGAIVGGQGSSTITVNWGNTNPAAWVKVTPTNNFGCVGSTDSLGINVGVQLAPRTPTGDTLLCSDQARNLTYQTGFTNGSQYIWRYLYDSAGTTRLVELAPQSNILNLSWPGAGNIRLWVEEISTTNTNTCSGISDTLNILINQSPDSTKIISGAERICARSTNNTYRVPATSGATYNWVLQSANGSVIGSLTDADSVIINAGLLADTLTLSFQETSAEGCIGKLIQKTIIVDSLPVVRLGLLDSTCSDQAITIGENPISGYRYNWSPATGLSDPTLANPVFSFTQPSGAQVLQYILTVTDTTTGCSNTDTLNIKVTALPVASAGPDVAICANGSAVLGSPLQNNLVYAWYLAPNKPAELTLTLGDTTQAELAISVATTATTPLTHPVVMAYRNSLTGCTNYDTVLVTVNPLPVVVIAPHDTLNVCANADLSFGGATVDSLRYQWFPSEGLNSDTSATVTLNLDNQTGGAIFRTYRLLVTNRITGCNSTDSVVVQVNPRPVITLTFPDSVCSRDSANISAAFRPNTTARWSPAIGLGNPNNFATRVARIHNQAAPLFAKYYITLTDTITGCVSRDSVQIQFNARPVANAGANQVVCSNEPFTLGTPALANLSYNWNPAPGLAGADLRLAQPTIRVINTSGAPQEITYFLRVINTSGCDSIAEVRVTVNPLPTAVLTDTVPVCSGQDVTLGTNPSPNYSYSWSPSENISASNIANPVFNASIPLGNARFFRYVLTVTDNQTNCLDTFVTVVRVNPLPTFDIPTNYSVCSNDSVEVGGPALGIYSFNWVDNGTATTSGFSYSLRSNVGSSTTVRPINTTGVPQVIRLRVNVTDLQTGCVNFDTTRVLVEPLPIAEAGNDVATCSNQAVSIGSAALLGLTYQWTPTTGLDLPTSAQPQLTLANNTQAPQTFVYRVRVTNTSTDCVNEDSVRVTINPLPQNLTGTLDSLCSGGTISIGAPALPNFSYQWSPSVGLSNPNSAQPNLTLTNSGTTVLVAPYTLRIVNTTTGCEATYTLNVRVNPLPIVNAGADQTTCSRQPITLGTPAIAGYAYRWLNTTGLNDATLAQPTLNILNQGGVNTLVYPLQVTNLQTGCVNTDTVLVTLRPEPVTVVLPYDSVVCNQTLRKTYQVQLNAGSIYTWNITGGTVVDDTQPNVRIVEWAADNTLKAISVQESSALGCAADVVNFKVLYNDLALQFVEVTRNPEADSIIRVRFRLLNLQNLPASTQVRIQRKLRGATEDFQTIGILGLGDSLYTESPANANREVYEYRILMNNLCGITLQTSVHNTIVLNGQALEAEASTSLNWTPYVGWANGVVRYNIYRKLEKDADFGSTPIASVPGNRTNWIANNGGDDFVQAYRIEAVEGNGQGRAISNMVVLQFANLPLFGNVITPNGDGFNDDWQIANIGLYPQHEITVYNRYGNVVYQTTNYDNNKAFNGEGLPAGTYYYQLNLKGDRPQVRKGWLEIMK